MGLDQSGSPQFTEAGSSLVNGAGRVGIGIPTITSYKGQPGTGIVWVTGTSVDFFPSHILTEPFFVVIVLKPNLASKL